jgi:signal transduction histidine kinase
MTQPAQPDARPRGPVRAWAPDAGLALAVTAVQLAATYASSSWGQWSGRHQAPPGWDVYLLLAVAGLALAARRRYPVAVLAVSLAATLAAGKLGGQLIWLPLIVAFVNAALARRRAAAAASLFIGYLGTTWPPWRIGSPGHASLALAAGLAAWLIVLLAITELVRIRGLRAAALERSREEELRRRASEDRMRIARDLHDVLAHNISVINVQANTALHLMDRQPDRAKEALTAIHGVSKQALAELRAVLGVLREGGQEGAPRSPGPGLARLADLLSSAGSAGLDVRLTVVGDPRAVPADADIAAYRIAQESLTNVRRHSGAATASLLVRYEAAGLAVEIEDPGAPLVASTAAPSAVAGLTGRGHAGQVRPAQSSRPGRAGPAGNGISGMAERVHELGGSFDAGPRPGGGFRVAAWLPARADDVAAGAGS